MNRELESLTESIHKTFQWLGHASFSFQPDTGEKVFFIDPFRLKQDFHKKADFIFVTHAHDDHWSPVDIKRILKPETQIFAPSGCSGLEHGNIETVQPGYYKNLDIIKVRAVPAYNVKTERLNFHPRENNWVGYVFTINGKTFYHAGDTDFIVEMKQLTDLDVAFLPIGGTYTMDVNEAAEAANAMMPKITVPMHYKALLKEESTAAEEKFKKAVKGEVLVLEEYK